MTAPTSEQCQLAIEMLAAKRRSVRAFLPTPVPQETIEKILRIAQQAPSNCNSQPWIVHIASGTVIEQLRQRLLHDGEFGAPQSDIPLTTGYHGVYKQRRIEAAIALFDATGVAREDEEARKRSFLRNFAMFDAPHVALIFMPSFCGMREAADCGMFAQTLMLALTAHRIGSCAQGALSHFMPAVREVLQIDDDARCLFGISFGYPDENDPSASALTTRAALDENITFHSA